MAWDSEAWERSINEAAELLKANGEEFWAGKLTSAINSPMYVKTFYGGMGSFNDLTFTDPVAAKRLRTLQSEIYALAEGAE